MEESAAGMPSRVRELTAAVSAASNQAEVLSVEVVPLRYALREGLSNPASCPPCLLGKPVPPSGYEVSEGHTNRWRLIMACHLLSRHKTCLGEVSWPYSSGVSRSLAQTPKQRLPTREFPNSPVTPEPMRLPRRL